MLDSKHCSKFQFLSAHLGANMRVLYYSHANVWPVNSQYRNEVSSLTALRGPVLLRSVRQQGVLADADSLPDGRACHPNWAAFVDGWDALPRAGGAQDARESHAPQV